MTAWEAAYLAENAAEFACRAAAGALTNPQRRRALQRASDHAAARTRIQPLLTNMPPLPAGYVVAVNSSEEARDLVIATENALVPVYADAAAEGADAQRMWAVEQAMACAVTAVRWGGVSQAFPQADSPAEAGDDVPSETQDQ